MLLVLTSALTLGGLAVALSLLLVVVNRRLFVADDPRVEGAEERLPHTNCGACGFPGCRAFAEALVGGDALPGQCTVSSDEARQRLAAFLGVEVGGEERRVARLACAGGLNVARNRATYRGVASCRAAAQVGGGGKSCTWGCLGLGDCAEVCDFDAIVMNAMALPVVIEDSCTACNACVEVCPKGLFSLQPVSRRLWVACKNEEAGDGVLESCRVACTACGRCVFDAPGGLITMRNNLPVIDGSKNHATRDPIERCPTGAIVWLGPDGPVYGRQSPRVIRREALPPTTT